MERIVRLIEIIAALIMAGVALFVFGGVVSRKLGYNLPDAFEISKYLQGIAITWGFAVATYHGSHIVVDVVWELAGGKGRRLIDQFAWAVMIISCVAIAYAFAERIGSVVASGRTTNELKLPIWWFYLPMAAGMLATAIMAFLGAAKALGGAASPQLPSQA